MEGWEAGFLSIIDVVVHLVDAVKQVSHVCFDFQYAGNIRLDLCDCVAHLIDTFDDLDDLMNGQYM